MKNTSKTSIPLLLVFLTGLSLLLYPTVSDHWNAVHQTRAIVSYTRKVDEMEAEQRGQMWQAAVDYNETLSMRSNPYQLSEEETVRYESLLNPAGNGVMCYVEIPLINCKLPVYHGTKETSLQTGIGHIEWTSLPVGGEGTHTVLSGHRGLPSARLFTDLDKLSEGDHFMLHVLDETLTYEVDQIRIVEPEDVHELLPKEGMDLCTLVTCHPYGINTHRLLIRGRRVENEESSRAGYVTADASIINAKLVAVFIAVPLFAVLLILLRAVRRFGNNI